MPLSTILLFLTLFVACIANIIGPKQKCCVEYGCFSDAEPYDGQPLPSCPQDIQPVLTMFNRQNRVNGEIFDPHQVPKMFTNTIRTVFLVHGWMNSDDTKWMSDMKAAFLNRENCNAVLVDWHKGANDLLYPDSASNTRTMGAFLAKSFDSLVATGNGSYSMLWCVGHSLGAHVCGQAGMQSAGKISRATGLDPAGPWFQYSKDLTVGINPESAAFVDILHATNLYGTFRPLGHIDFYPDGGKSLTGCLTDVCSHNFIPTIMIESIYSDCYKTKQICPSNEHLPRSCSYCICDSEPCAYMGYAADRSCLKSGIFYLDTNRNAPYCKN